MSLRVQAPAFCHTTRLSYRHTPYDDERSTFVDFVPTVESARPAPGRATLHKMLTGLVHHIAYPTESFAVAPVTDYELSFMHQKVFIGQLPFQVTEMQLVWLCALLGVRVALPQRITRTVDGEKKPTGGVHVYCTPADFTILQQNMHKRVLLDDSGVWFAVSEEQKHAMDSYVGYLHSHKNKRHAGRPYGSVVIQEAQSTYVPRRLVHFDE